MAFPIQWMDALLAKNEIVGLISQYVPLKPKGGRMWGCCPFHNEKTPSFSVSGDKQLYYCFGCHAGGNVIQFVMDMERLSYAEAIRFLAERVGMELPEAVDDERIRADRMKRERIYAANREAARYYARQLRSEAGKDARAYLVRRGLERKTLAGFGLGYAPAGWDNLYNSLREQGFADQELVDAGLAIQGKKDGYYDFFRNRVIFPIQDPSGRVLGFGGRTMGEDTPKYINTGDTLVFNKRRNLYALNRMRGKKLADMVIAEGYLDVISLHQHGIDNAVATLGTALTPEQARKIRQHYTDKLFLCYDGDTAGINAALRGIDILEKEGLQVKVITIPDGLDPDDFVKANGQEGFLELKGKAMSAPEFRITQIAAQQDMESEDGREAFARSACAYLSRLQPVEQERYVPLVARKAGISVAAVQAQCRLEPQIMQKTHTARTSRHTKTKIDEKVEPGDSLLLACMLASKKAAETVCMRMAELQVEPADEIESEAIAEIMALYALSEIEEKPDFNRLLYEKGTVFVERFAAAQLSEESLIDPVRTAADCVRDRRQRGIRCQMEALTAATRDCADEAELREKTSELMKLQTAYTQLK